MTNAKNVGSPTGSGNPPGKHSTGYTNYVGDRGHFVNGGSYRGSMNIGRKDVAPIVGNQPSQRKETPLSSPPSNTDPIHQ